MASRLVRALRLILVLQWRAYFPHVYLGLALMTLAAFRFAVPPEWTPLLLPAFLLGEQGIIAMTLVAAHLYLERNEGSLTALAVTPLGSAEYVAALVLGTSVFACVSGALIWAGAIGLDARVGLLVPPLLLLSVFSGLLGLSFATRFDEFTSFLMLGAVPAAGVIGLPLLSYFGVVPYWTFAWLPSDWALRAFGLLTEGAPDLQLWLGCVGAIALFCAVAFPLVSRLYQVRIRERLEPVYE